MLVVKLLIVFTLFLIIVYIYKLTAPLDLLPQYKVNSLYKNMSCLDKIFTDNKLGYFIICGTLIGAVRDKGLIPWDHDIDIGIMETDLPKMLALKDQFASVGMVMSFDDDIWRIKNKDDITYIDVFLFEKTDKLYRYNDTKNRRRFPSETFGLNQLYPLKRYQFGPLNLLGPQKAEEYLDNAYGNWRVAKVTQSEGFFKWLNVGGINVTGKYKTALPDIDINC